MDSVNLDTLYQQTMARFDQIFPSSGSAKLIDHKSAFLSNTTTKKQCEHCGSEINKAVPIKHSIVPNDISKQIGLKNVKVVDLCFPCHRAIHEWNASSVSGVMHGKKSRLKAKPLIEVAKEYEAAYQNFVKNKLNESYYTKQLLPQVSSA